MIFIKTLKNTKFNTLNYEFDRPLPKEKNKKSNCIHER